MTGEFTFLMCSERSGSNLVSRMFDAHPQVCAPTPAHLVRLLAEHRGAYGDLAEGRAWSAVLADTADLLATKVGAWRTAWDPDRLDAAAGGRRELGALLRGVLRAEARAHGKQRLFLKENHLHRYLPFVQRSFPGLRILAMVRDPRDMALSWKNSAILRGDAVRAARVWREDQAALVRVRGWLGPDTVHLLTYEDLVRDPEARLADACAFLGLDPDPAMLGFHARPEAREHAAASDDWRNVARPVMRDNVAKWRHGLDRTEAAYVEKLCAAPMAALGYAPETDDPRDLAALEAALLPRERHDKPGWADVPAAEKELRGARAAVVARMAAREPAHA